MRDDKKEEDDADDDEEERWFQKNCLGIQEEQQQQGVLPQTYKQTKNTFPCKGVSRMWWGKVTPISQCEIEEQWCIETPDMKDGSSCMW